MSYIKTKLEKMSSMLVKLKTKIMKKMKLERLIKKKSSMKKKEKLKKKVKRWLKWPL